MGPSGSGKTTLLNLLAGIDTPTAGSLRIGGVELAGLSRAALARWRADHVGYVFQLYNLVPVLTAYENVELPLLVSGVKPKVAREKAMNALAKVSLENWASHRPAELSGGQRQRVTVARSIVNDPAIIWADEPTGALDSSTAQEIIDLMIDLNKRSNLTFVIVTHDPGVGAQCDRIVRMIDGQIVGQEIPGRTPLVGAATH